jgi:hypothetical protein
MQNIVTSMATIILCKEYVWEKNIAIVTTYNITTEAYVFASYYMWDLWW